jgi:hypothetical protein
MVQILRPHVHKWNIEAIQGIGGWIKENGGGGEFNYDKFDIRTFVNATITSHNNKEMIK